MSYICGNGEDLEVSMITGSRMGTARGREGGRQQGHMKEKMKSDLVNPRICGRKKGRGGSKNKSVGAAGAGS